LISEIEISFGGVMTRGIFSQIVENKAYKESKKDWYVEISRSDMYWYDLVMNSTDEFNTKKMIVGYLSSLRKAVEESLEKRFVYFICSRPKVRFNMKTAPSYGLLNGRLNFNLLVGGEGRKISASTVFRDAQTGKLVRPKVEVSEKFISISYQPESVITMSVHDFLMAANTEVGLSTQVHYVGYTKNPETRPTNGAHSGLNEVLYRISNRENDIFVIFNLFKIMSRASNPNYMMDFVVPNSMTDEIKVDLEGKVVEKCFINYFDSSSQSKNKSMEKTQLSNNLFQLASENKINSIQIHYELEVPTEYWCLGSSSIKASHRHLFTVDLDGGEVRIRNGSTLYDEAYGGLVTAEMYK
jgi:hypothetical protein